MEEETMTATAWAVRATKPAPSSPAPSLSRRFITAVNTSYSRSAPSMRRLAMSSPLLFPWYSSYSSSSPSHNCFLAALYDQQIYFCQLGKDERWNLLNHAAFMDASDSDNDDFTHEVRRCVFTEIVYFSEDGAILWVLLKIMIAWNLKNPSCPKCEAIPTESDAFKDDGLGDQYYLVESSGDLLQVIGLVNFTYDNTTTSTSSSRFEVYKADFDEHLWKAVEELG